MSAPPAYPLIIDSDRMDNSIIVSFEDGKTALYSAALLYELLPRAQELPSDSGVDLA